MRTYFTVYSYYFLSADHHMGSSSRDEFKESVKRVLAERAAYICSNPKCRKPTVGPHSDPEKSLKTGEAAHIRAAAAGGPRYDSTQSNEARRTIQNGIWLCTECSTKVDADEAAYSAQALLDWKVSHEASLRSGGILPSLPQLELVTAKGITLPDEPSQITGEQCREFREHWLTIRNQNDAPLLMLDVRVQLHEPIVRATSRHTPIGTSLTFEPIRMSMVALIQGNGTVTRARPPLPVCTHQLQIDRLPAGHFVELMIWTSRKIYDEHDLDMNAGPFGTLATSPETKTFVDGNFSFDYQGAVCTRHIFAPLGVDVHQRSLSILEVREDYGTWQPLTTMMFS